jgi:hypothetical protein
LQATYGGARLGWHKNHLITWEVRNATPKWIIPGATNSSHKV